MGGGGGMGGGGARGPPKERQMTAKGQMALGANSRPALSDLNPQMVGMFRPRPPLPFKKPMGKMVVTARGGGDEGTARTALQEKFACTGLAGYLSTFETTPAPAPSPPLELPAERKKRVHEHLNRLQSEKNDLLAAQWDPHDNKRATE
jgi:hypothetical protein